MGVDGSRGGGRALAWALDRARRTASDVRVVRAYDQPERWPASPAEGLGVDDAWVQRMIRTSVHGEVEHVLADQAGHEGAEPRVQIDAVAGHPLEVLLSASRRAGMLVVGHRDLGAVRATVLGSTALNLLVLARCPVTVVPSSDHTSPVAASRTDEPTVVVGVDRSKGSRRAMRHALEEAATRGARVLAVSAFLPALTGPGLTMAAAPRVEDVRHAVQAQIRPFVEDIVAGFSAGHGGVCPPVRVQVQATSPVWALVDAAREAGAELIVIGHRGRGALATRLLGSVGHGVLLQASCPVTMIPEPDDVAPEPELAAPAPDDRQESPRPVGPIA